MASGADDAKAIALADQAVLDAQGGGHIKDLAGIQRGGPPKKLFTSFYSFFNTTYNLSVEGVKRTDFKKSADVGRLVVDFLLLYTIPAVLGQMVIGALRSDRGDDDDLAEKLIRAQLAYLTGTMVGAARTRRRAKWIQPIQRRRRNALLLRIIKARGAGGARRD